MSLKDDQPTVTTSGSGRQRSSRSIPRRERRARGVSSRSGQLMLSTFAEGVPEMPVMEGERRRERNTDHVEQRPPLYPGASAVTIPRAWAPASQGPDDGCRHAERYQQDDLRDGATTAASRHERYIFRLRAARSQLICDGCLQTREVRPEENGGDFSSVVIHPAQEGPTCSRRCCSGGGP